MPAGFICLVFGCFFFSAMLMAERDGEGDPFPNSDFSDS